MTGEDRMDKQVMREQFEAWVLREYPNQNMGRFSDGEYHSTTVQYCWLSWQASREAVEVELPKMKAEGANKPGESVAHAMNSASETMRELVKIKLESLGLKVKT